jgi:hypothetical protein
MDLIASSAVNFPIISASLRLVVIWTGGSILCTKAGARLPRLTFTTNFMFFKISPIRSEPETDGSRDKLLPISSLAATAVPFPVARAFLGDF